MVVWEDGCVGTAEGVISVAGLDAARPDRQLLAAMARLAGADRVLVTGESLGGESRSAFAVAAGEGELVVKLVLCGELASQRRLVRLVGGLRERGCPAPEYLGAGEAGGTVFTVQRRLPGQTLHRGPGLAPEPELLAAVLPSLLAAIELQAGAGDLDRPPWPSWLTETIEAGGDGYCLHATMRQDPRTAALLRRLQALARRNLTDQPRTRDVVHIDMNPANILHAGRQLTGVVDWNILFDGAGQGDRGFDVATLLFYSYDITLTRNLLWDRALELSGLAWTTIYLCHLSLRQVEWSRRHNPASADDALRGHRRSRAGRLRGPRRLTKRARLTAGTDIPCSGGPPNRRASCNVAHHDRLRQIGLYVYL